METKTNELIEIVETSGLEPATGIYLKEKFLPFFEQAESWKRKAESLVVTDIYQIREMKMAREARLALKEIRVNADKVRKDLKEDSIRYGRAVQGVYNVIEYLISPIEKHLEAQERFVEIQEANQKAQLAAEREALIHPYREYAPAWGVDYSVLSEEDFTKLLNGCKLQHEQKIIAEKRAAEEMVARQKAEAEERERIRVENEKLRAEAEEKARIMSEKLAKAAEERKAAEAKAAKERAEAEAKLKAERDARAKAEAELKAKADAELKAKKAAEAKAAAELKVKKEAERKAKAAPDKIKLLEFANTIDKFPLPELKSEDGKLILTEVTVGLARLVQLIEEKCDAL